MASYMRDGLVRKLMTGNYEGGVQKPTAVEAGEGEGSGDDMSMALSIMNLMDNAWQDPEGRVPQEDYVEEAKEVLKVLTNPMAKKMLEEAIEKHSQKMEEVG